jgi:hypothetical protein
MKFSPLVSMFRMMFYLTMYSMSAFLGFMNHHTQTLYLHNCVTILVKILCRVK